MKVVLLSSQQITGKDGRKWVKYEGISLKGESTSLFLSTAQDEQFGMASVELVPKDDLAEFLKQYKSVDASFDQRGRLESVEV